MSTITFQPLLTVTLHLRCNFITSRLPETSKVKTLSMYVITSNIEFIKKHRIANLCGRLCNTINSIFLASFNVLGFGFNNPRDD